MYKAQNAQQKNKQVEIPKITEKAVAHKLESSSKVDPPTQASITVTSAPKVLEISKSSFKYTLTSKNNNKTPIKSRVIIYDPTEDDDQSDQKHLNIIDQNKKQTTQVSDAKPTENNVATDLKTVTDKLNTSIISISTETQSRPKETATKTTETCRVDYRNTCTCSLINNQEPKPAPVPLQLPKKPETPKGPIYRWVAVKAESMKTEEEKQAEIRLLLPKVETPVNVTSKYRRKPRLCTYCWNKKKSNEFALLRNQVIEERNLRTVTPKKKKNKPKNPVPDNKSSSNRFSVLLGEESA